MGALNSSDIDYGLYLLTQNKLIKPVQPNVIFGIVDFRKGSSTTA